jgi:hypothetical protein
MTDNITLPRAVVEQVWEALMGIPADQHRVNDALIDLEAALAEPEKERAEVAAPARDGVASSMEEIDILTPESYRTTEPPAKPEPEPEPDAIARAVEAEREACKKECDEIAERFGGTAWACSEAIRARGCQK